MRKQKKKWYRKQLEMPFVKGRAGRWHMKNKKTKRKGNPVFALRVDTETLSAFIKSKGGKANAQAAVRRFMARSS